MAHIHLRFDQKSPSVEVRQQKLSMVDAQIDEIG
jgi:hypothetical protein